MAPVACRMTSWTDARLTFSRSANQLSTLPCRQEKLFFSYLFLTFLKINFYQFLMRLSTDWCKSISTWDMSIEVVPGLCSISTALQDCNFVCHEKKEAILLSMNNIITFRVTFRRNIIDHLISYISLFTKPKLVEKKQIKRKESKYTNENNGVIWNWYTCTCLNEKCGYQ